MSYDDGFCIWDFTPMVYFVVFLFIGLMLANLLPLVTITDGYKSDYKELYYAQAPFGVLYADTSGHSSGNFMWSSGDISTTLSENYVLKYWENGKILSMSLKASETPIVVDNTFRVEANYTIQHLQPIFEWFGEGFRENLTAANPHYTLHLPSLPENVTNHDWKVAP